jgi:hypothetical protein
MYLFLLDNRLRNGAFGGSGGAAALAALAGGIGYLGSNKDKTDLNHPAEATTTPNQRNISSSSGLEHNPHIDAAHIPVPEEHMDFLSHRFAEAEHGAPTTDDGGNLIMTEGVDLKSVAPSSDSGYNSNLTHHPHAGTAQLPVPDEHLDFLSHRFAEAEHGAPTTDDGGNTIFANGFDPTSSLLASGSGISSRLLRQDNQQDRSRDQLDQSFLHNRLDDFTAIFTTTAPTTAAAEKVSLTPKTNIGVGAGYNDSNNPVPADEVIDNLRRKASASYAGAGLAGAGLASAASRRSISHGQVKRRVSIFPNGESIIDRLDQDTTTNTGNQFNKGASIGQTGTADSERTSDPRKSSHGIGASGMSAAGVGAGVGTLRGIDDEGRGDHSQDSILKDRLSKGSEGVEEIKADQSLVHGPGSQDETLYKSPTDLLDNTTRNIQNNAIHPNDSDTQEKTLDNTTGNIQENNASDMLATNQSTSGDKSRAAAMAATGAGLGAGLGTMMTNRDNQTSNLQSTQDQNQSIGPLATNDQYDFTRDTPISANKLVNKLETSTSDLIDDDGESISADEIIRQLKDILAKIQKNPEYQQAISSLLSLFNDWSQYLKSGTMDDRRRSSAVSASEQKEYYATTASREAKTIIEDWAQSKSLDPLIQKGSDLASKLKQDDNLQKLYEKVNNNTSFCLLISINTQSIFT